MSAPPGERRSPGATIPRATKPSTVQAGRATADSTPHSAVAAVVPEQGRPSSASRPGGRPALPDVIGCVEAETAVLGCLLLLDRPGAQAMADRLEPEDFTDPRHRLVLTGVRAVLEAGGRPDPVLVLAELRRSGAERSFLTDRSAGSFLVDLDAGTPVASNAGWYHRAVVEHRVRRRVQEAASRLEQVAGTGSMADVLAHVDAELAAVREQAERVAPERRDAAS